MSLSSTCSEMRCTSADLWRLWWSSLSNSRCRGKTTSDGVTSRRPDWDSSHGLMSKRPRRMKPYSAPTDLKHPPLSESHARLRAIFEPARGTAQGVVDLHPN